MKYRNLFLVIILILIPLTCNEAAGKVNRCRVLWAGCPDDYVIHHDASDMNSWLEGDIRQVKFWNCEDHVWSSDTCDANCTSFFASQEAAINMDQPVHYWDRWTAYTPCGELPRSMWAKHTTDEPEKVTCSKCKEKIKNVKRG